MQSKKNIYLTLIAGISAALILSGCPKKVETAKSAATVTEEKVTPPAEVVKPEPPPLPTPAPNIEETPVAKEVTISAQDLSDVHFDFDQYNIRDDARPVLEKTARLLNGSPSTRLKIEGHCDERGTSEYNLALGERRAKAVKEFLMAMGVSGNRLSTISYGEERSLCTAHNEDCYAKNRRAHFMIQ